ncbi:hypothetical protein MtrunA17_Chr8g0364511 [Medicago truncatula]|uniref:Uncharacterized protein n=1 Tax=Medicago truncatula TaxID=3880 RepID=A0A396GJX3_MEDTR|nr:hypothetical protein MtrunA17_Chr8g0364511 [Medicago truncatula]
MLQLRNLEVVELVGEACLLSFDFDPLLHLSTCTLPLSYCWCPQLFLGHHHQLHL